MSGLFVKRFDKGWIGFVLGLFAPLLSLFVFYLIKYNHLSFPEFYYRILVANEITTAVISLCVITNLLVFFIFIWANRNFSARGVLFATLVYTLYVFYLKQVR